MIANHLEETDAVPDPNADIDALVERAQAVIARWDSLLWKAHEPTARLVEDLRAAVERLTAVSNQPPHPDDVAVDAFASAMKAKLAQARAKGRGGWQDHADCPQQRLSRMLRSHVEKGDPVDVANFACFLWNRGEGVLPETVA